MSAGKPTCGVVVPVRDEADLLPRTVPALLEAASGERARIVWVCNGCTDDSVSRIRSLAGSGAEILVLAEAGKAAALQAGDEALGGVFPRVYRNRPVWTAAAGQATALVSLAAAQCHGRSSSSRLIL